MMNVNVTTKQYVDDEVKYTETYSIGIGCDYETVDDLKAELDELVGAAIDRYEIEITYEAWVMMNSDNDVITDEYDTPEEAINELLARYTIEEMHEAGFTCNKLLCTDGSWLECLEEIDY